MADSKAVAEAYRILGTIHRFLGSTTLPKRPDAKIQIRLAMDLPGLDFVETMKSSYTTPETPIFVALVDAYNTVFVDRNSGIELDGINISWDMLASFAKEMVHSGLYMNSTEEAEYAEHLAAVQKIQAEEMEKQINSPFRENRMEAAKKYGPPAWDKLMHDPDEFVRATVACYADGPHQVEMVTDESPLIRGYLAENGGDLICRALLAVGERESCVLREIVKHGSPGVQIELIHTLERDLPILQEVAHGLCIEAKRELLQSGDPHIAVLGADAADEKQCAKLLAAEGLDYNEHYAITSRLDELREEKALLQEK